MIQYLIILYLAGYINHGIPLETPLHPACHGIQGEMKQLGWMEIPLDIKYQVEPQMDSIYQTINPPAIGNNRQIVPAP